MFVKTFVCAALVATSVIANATSNTADAKSKSSKPADTSPTPIKPSGVFEGQSQKVKMDGKYQQLRWPDLIPDADLQAMLNPPDELNDIMEGSADDALPSGGLKSNASIGDSAYAKALVSTNVKPEYNNHFIKLPAFIVPLEFTDDNTITTFFAVPFFGACIHVPPPPPNQIIYATYKKGFKVNQLYEPFWLYGKLSTKKLTNDMATAAYSIEIDDIGNFKITDDY